MDNDDRRYKVSDPDGKWSVEVVLIPQDVDVIRRKYVTMQILQICKDAVERSIRMALARQSGEPYDESMPIDVETLTYDDIR